MRKIVPSCLTTFHSVWSLSYEVETHSENPKLNSKSLLIKFVIQKLFPRTGDEAHETSEADEADQNDVANFTKVADEATRLMRPLV